MNAKAKLFRTGGSQAVRLPKAFSFPEQDSVSIRREGDCVILEPLRRKWSPKFLALAGSAPDFELPPDPPIESADPGPDFDSR